MTREPPVGTIEVVEGSGSGRTRRSALDAALAAAGVGDYNLVRLSSIVPADATVRATGTHDREWATGRPVACVLADAVGPDRVAAGLGWATAPEGGVFMECTGTCAADCRDRLVAGVDDARARREWAWEDGADPVVRTEILEHETGDASDAPGGDGAGTGAAYACAVVAAVYAPLELIPATSAPDG